MHVASVRLPSASAFAIERDAAERAVRATLASVSQGCTLRSIFERGLAVEIFKSSRRAHVSGDRRLLALKRREVIEALELQDRAHYRALVRAAAQAAVRAEIEERSLFRRRVSSCERVALEEIDEVFSSTGWQIRD